MRNGRKEQRWGRAEIHTKPSVISSVARDGKEMGLERENSDCRVLLINQSCGQWQQASFPALCGLLMVPSKRTGWFLLQTQVVSSRGYFTECLVGFCAGLRGYFSVQFSLVLCSVNSSCLGLPTLSSVSPAQEICQTLPRFPLPESQPGNSWTSVKWSNHRVYLI